MSVRLQKERETLPVSGIAAALNGSLGAHGTVIVTAAPGAGKSTLLPLTMLEALPQGGKIVMLEPRRVAARQIAQRMAWLLEEPVGETVGYRIRFESKVSALTRIEVVTEGILSRMLLDDPALEGVSVVIFDEFHERSLVSDEALALVRQTQQLLREDLRMVIMSATIDTAALSAALEAPVLESEGKMFPVEILRTREEADASNVSELVARTVLEAHRSQAGDILAFLPGEGEIRRCAELLSGNLGATHIAPLYGLLSNAEQASAIAPSGPGERKVVLATPIAETSLTIEGVRVVVDSGLCRKLVFDPRSGLSHLETVRISLDMATQRSGRAGRVAPGVCYRLWSTATEARMAPVRTPEILEADLSTLALDTAAWGESRVENLPWLTPPPKAAILQARELLEALGALDADGRITAHGKALSRIPCHPRIAQMLLKADSALMKALAADIAAILEEKDPLSGEISADMDLRLEALRRARGNANPGRWARIHRSARQYAQLSGVREENTPVGAGEAGQLLASAYPERIGRAWHEGVGRFQLSGGDIVALDPADPLGAAEWLVVASMHRAPGGVGKAFLAAKVAPGALQEYARQRDHVFWDARAGAVVARRESRIGAILLDSKPLSEGVADKMLDVICGAALKEGLSMFDFSGPVENLQRRIAFVAARHPELELPDVSTEAILASAPEWGPLFIGRATTAAQLRKVDLCSVIWSRLSHSQQQAVEALAPTHVTVPTGSRIGLEYRQGSEVPVLRVRLQECFGLLDTPLADGEPILMELLSPGYKPVQLTRDLRSFWEGTYFEVRKELRRRYPKHAWPEDPLSADPVRGVRRTH